MAVPAFLNTTHRYLSTPGVTDCNTCISDLATELGALSWTESAPGSGLWQSPDDSYGRHFSILIERNAAANFHITTYDQNDLLIYARRIVLDGGGGCEVRYYTGSHHVVVEFQNSGTKQIYAGCMLMMNPEDDSINQNYVVCRGSVTTAGAAAEGINLPNWGMLVNGTPNTAARLTVWGDGSGSAHIPTMPGGTRLYVPAYMAVTHGGVTYACAGVIPQCLMGSRGTAGSAYTVPIDTSTTATFHNSHATAGDRGAYLFWRAD